RLVCRQGRWAFVAILLAAVVLGAIAHTLPALLWPVGSLLLGVACGLVCFAPDQHGGREFLAAHRFPLGRLWIAKVLCWGAAVLLMICAGCIAAGDDPAFLANDWFADGSRKYEFFSARLHGDADVFLIGLWPLYGFCFGQCFGLLTPRAITAAF